MGQTSLVIHGHFYQPPRENPRTGAVESQSSARPFHDWNERVHAECYRPNSLARIVDSGGRVGRIVNNYERLSFNFGPTLLAWIERSHAGTYRRILAADAASLGARGGHGNAIAQGYHHAILPLASERDRRTEIRWGLADFRRRFRREPEALWLPETAADAATLSALAEEGLRYVILSPFQAARVRRIGASEDDWQTVGGGQIDASVPYLFRAPGAAARSIAIFFYDGSAARAVAYEGALASSRLLVDQLESAARGGRGGLVNVATDGESYGHHSKWGDRCLAFALEHEAPRRGFRVTNYGEFLERNPPEFEVELATGPEGEGTAWSCAHGLGRWSRDCGCHTGGDAGWNQRWRAPLRRALNFLRDEAAKVFEDQGGELLADPWRARDGYVELMLDRAAAEKFFREESRRALDDEARARALALLEMQRHTLMTFTSCGWFFNDLSGIETVQVLRYAARALELLEATGVASPRSQFLEQLAEAESNAPGAGNGADIFRRDADSSSQHTSVGRRDSDERREIVAQVLLRMLEAEPSAAAYEEALKIAAELGAADYLAGGSALGARLESLLAGSVREALASDDEEWVTRVANCVRLARELGLHDAFERAQEIVYEALASEPEGASLASELEDISEIGGAENGARAGEGARLNARALASVLNLAPALFGDFQAAERAAEPAPEHARG